MLLRKRILLRLTVAIRIIKTYHDLMTSILLLLKLLYHLQIKIKLIYNIIVMLIIQKM